MNICNTTKKQFSSLQGGSTPAPNGPPPNEESFNLFSLEQLKLGSKLVTIKEYFIHLDGQLDIIHMRQKL